MWGVSLIFAENSILLNQKKITSTLHEDTHALLRVSRQICIGTKMFREIVREKMKHFISDTFSASIRIFVIIKQYECYAFISELVYHTINNSLPNTAED
jgi:hypothetical protein